MSISLAEAPFNLPLVLVSVTDSALALRLKRIGLFEGNELVRLDREVTVQSIRVRGPGGEALLGGGMAMKTIVHTPDGRKLPLSELQPGEEGHIEGLTGGTTLHHVLEVLGLKADAPVQVLRKLPAMEYTAVLDTGGRVRLTEGMSAKIWGEMEGRILQFVCARVGTAFHVREILGGDQAMETLRNQGVEPGRVLRLEGVTPVQSLNLSSRTPVVISATEGLRLFLDPRDARQMLVRPASGRE